MIKENQVTLRDAQAIAAALIMLNAGESSPEETGDAKCQKQDSDDSTRNSRIRRQRRAEQDRKKTKKKKKRQI